MPNMARSRSIPTGWSGRTCALRYLDVTTRSSPDAVMIEVCSLRYAQTRFDVLCGGGARGRRRFRFRAAADDAAEAGRDGSLDAGASDRDAGRHGLGAALRRDRSLRWQK